MADYKYSKDEPMGSRERTVLKHLIAQKIEAMFKKDWTWDGFTVERLAHDSNEMLLRFDTPVGPEYFQIKISLKF